MSAVFEIRRLKEKRAKKKRAARTLATTTTEDRYELTHAHGRQQGGIRLAVSTSCWHPGRYTLQGNEISFPSASKPVTDNGADNTVTPFFVLGTVRLITYHVQSDKHHQYAHDHLHDPRKGDASDSSRHPAAPMNFRRKRGEEQHENHAYRKPNHGSHVVASFGSFAHRLRELSSVYKPLAPRQFHAGHRGGHHTR